MYDTYQQELQNRPPEGGSTSATPGGDISRPMSTMSGTDSKKKTASEEDNVLTSGVTGKNLI